ncbi:hypothetical protein CDL15_Pgr010286 [Punica granatum]|uniref:Uncharacterized protein n=1 Tax=Punica granatum TaxID=22663 RepID=A0A218W1J9_PUNGR|nr:hypothetical protein CDL15_Pgr010286 [Punica granatum]PKI45868.1 hypothetical protein CRG98_033743 [Punica granatum]
MGDGDRERATLAKARMELEELYLGIPDDSVNLTFQDLADVQLHHRSDANSSSDNKEINMMMTMKKKNKSKNKNIPLSATPLLNPICEGANTTSSTSVDVVEERSSLPASPCIINTSPKSYDVSPHHDGPAQMNKVPSLDFSRALRASNHRHHRRQHDHHQSANTIGGGGGDDHYMIDDDSYHATSREHHQTTQLPAHPQQHRFAHYGDHDDNGMIMSSSHHHHGHDHDGHGQGHSNMSMVASSMAAYEDASIYSNYGPQTERSAAAAGVVRRRRPGIPHSNICTVCTTYIYFFRHRCLVCGRVYCRQCVSAGMGEMTEGRKCIECLGKRFSLKYMRRAGKVGCFCFGYGSEVKQAELKWADKGPRRSRESVGYGRSSAMMSRSRSPMGPRGPLHEAHSHASISNSNPPSFVTGSPYSPAAHRHYLPF